MTAELAADLVANMTQDPAADTSVAAVAEELAQAIQHLESLRGVFDSLRTRLKSGLELPGAGAQAVQTEWGLEHLTGLRRQVFDVIQASGRELDPDEAEEQLRAKLLADRTPWKRNPVPRTCGMRYSG